LLPENGSDCLQLSCKIIFIFLLKSQFRMNNFNLEKKLSEETEIQKVKGECFHENDIGHQLE
jgi:hypothetical protein